jgi:hypothetical protein
MALGTNSVVHNTSIVFYYLWVGQSFHFLDDHTYIIGPLLRGSACGI